MPADSIFTGANPATIQKGSPYIDLGATVVDPAFGTTPANTNLGSAPPVSTL